MSSYYLRDRTPGTAPATCLRCGGGMHAPLTKRQAQILAYLQGYIVQHGYAPNFQEIADSMGYTSHATVHEHLANLERKGWIRRAYNEARGIEILGTVPHELTDADHQRLAELRDLNERYSAVAALDSAEGDALLTAHTDTFTPETLRWLINLAAAQTSRPHAEVPL